MTSNPVDDGRARMGRYDLLDVSDGDDAAVELAHAVSARVAAELAGLPVALTEDRIATAGS